MELKDQIKIILYKKTVQIKEENMSKSKVHMPKELEKKCHIAIHAATTAAAAAGAIPLPMADAVPITAAQIGMIVSLGKIFDITITQATAKSIAGIVMAQKNRSFSLYKYFKVYSRSRYSSWGHCRCIYGSCINRSAWMDCCR